MDMQEIFKNGCFSPVWSGAEEVQPTVLPQRKDVNELLEELAGIKENIENLQAKSWYLERLRQFTEHGLTKT